MGKLFGTDGIRGRANREPMTPETALKVGKAVALSFKNDNQASRIIIGKDTRQSGDMIESALVAGICSAGVDVYLAGVLPTPGIAFLASDMAADAGIVISASHNPYFDNGIKIFKGDGFKLPDEVEEKIENFIFDSKALAALETDDVGRIFHIDDASQRYGEFLKKTLPETIDPAALKIVIDCANGAACTVAPHLFEELGVGTSVLFAEPDGKNINDNCGSQHTESLAEKVIETGADMGLAFDGDADRLIAVDEKGARLTGDQIIAICVKYAKQKGALKNDTAVTTVMSNIGLCSAFREMGVKHLMAKVGDRYVLEDMLKSGASIGGEDSGHMIFLDHHTTGDGILSALKLIEATLASGRPLSELAGVMKVFPQKLINIDVREKPEIETVPAVKKAIDDVENELGENGRVLVRYSGTQPMCRVMVEGPTAEETERYCREIADVVRRELGS